MRIGVICPSEIAIRRFMPALNKIPDLQYVGVGINSIEERYGKNIPTQNVVEQMLLSERKKAEEFVDNYGGKIFDSYEDMVSSNEIEAVYIPLPPALHYKWAKKALKNGKHVLVEKPATIKDEDTIELIELAKKRKLAFHENYMFSFHNQLDAIDHIVASGEIGDVRLYRISFGFPKRANNDFRYNKALGGGALIDAGGYTIKYATRLLGDTAKICCANMNNIDGYEVDMYGSATMINANGVTAQLAFGMDNNYKCDLEIWGSKGCLTTHRVLTAPVDFIPKAIIRKGNEDTIINLPSDDSFGKSIEKFISCVKDEQVRNQNYAEIIMQAKLVEQFRNISNEINRK